MTNEQMLDFLIIMLLTLMWLHFLKYVQHKYVAFFCWPTATCTNFYILTSCLIETAKWMTDSSPYLEIFLLRYRSPVSDHLTSYLTVLCLFHVRIGINELIWSLGLLWLCNNHQSLILAINFWHFVTCERLHQLDWHVIFFSFIRGWLLDWLFCR